MITFPSWSVSLDLFTSESVLWGEKSQYIKEGFFITTEENMVFTVAVGHIYRWLQLWVFGGYFTPSLNLCILTAVRWKNGQMTAALTFSGAHHCVCAVLRADPIPQPHDLQSEEQGAEDSHQEDSGLLQTCCHVYCKGHQYITTIQPELSRVQIILQMHQPPSTDTLNSSTIKLSFSWSMIHFWSSVCICHVSQIVLLCLFGCIRLMLFWTGSRSSGSLRTKVLNLFNYFWSAA